MSLLAEAPTAPAAVVAPRQRRSWLPWLAAVLVLAGVVGSLVVVAPRAASFPAITVRATGAPFVTIPDYGPLGSDILGYEHGAVVRLTLPLRNGGLLPVTVTSVQLGGGPAPLLAERSVEGLPLSLRPGGHGDVTVIARLTNCKYFHEREMQIYSSVQVGFTSFGRQSTRSVDFDRPVLVKSPMIVGCPDRKLNRQADNRRDLL
jgi:hypothetical protein